MPRARRHPPRRRRRAPPRRPRRRAASIAGQTTKPWRPSSTSSARRSQTRGRQPGRSASGTTCDSMPARPAGSSRIVDTSRSPKTVIATVRGMGVAVSTSTCGGCCPFSRSASRCSTPNRCCSSTTTRPRSANDTASPMSACVPTTMRDWPAAARSSAFRRSAAGSWPVSSVGTTDADRSGPSIRAIERRCCAASTSVGARSADCPPESATASMARSATTVLPEPTSPWTSRFIGTGCSRSSAISAPTSCWSAVSENGSERVESLEQPAGRRMPRGRRVRAQLRAPQQQRRLQHERLGEPQRAPRRLPVGLDLGPVDRLERPPLVEQRPRLRGPRRARGRRRRRARRGAARSTWRAASSRACPWPGRSGSAPRPSAWPPRHPPSSGRRVVEELVVGVRELAMRPCSRPTLPAKMPRAPGPQVARAPRLVEEGEGQDAGAVGDLRLEDRAAALSASSRSRTSSTSATIVTFSSSGRLASAVSSPRRAYRRG